MIKSEGTVKNVSKKKNSSTSASAIGLSIAPWNVESMIKSSTTKVALTPLKAKTMNNMPKRISLWGKTSCLVAYKILETPAT